MAGLIRPDRCETCRFVLKDVAGAQLVCRRMPPVPTAILAQTAKGVQQVGLVSNFPPVSADWACGEWKAQAGS